ncbi:MULTISPECIES: AAA family ATPase [unclassified Anabaena]|jgi:predicted ATP-binding protein involved in virulence|uniref:AAA family ATPase n=1 Tax=unclassified Anabaena TaxID=2619674 RepID=UPI0006AC5C11|nr:MULTISPECIES: AAA family ATPase [unclassified Anabaena]ALB43275.1 chromosome segregation protein SMC [Anabaena sp. WA102]MCX5984712.1 AAA family ATPase [Nostocales cyanobacterium LacPavin_0920_SED1_MAG_38_18]OBQ21104.1 MAG: chromosome segregation protein SMC [Anabaena sp. AL93]
MHIQKVIIKNFRCFEHLEVNLDPDINIFVGNNGSGKSALLDGIAAAMFASYIRCIQLIESIRYQQTNPFSQEDFSVKQKENQQKHYAEFTVSTTDFLDWRIVYEKKFIYNKEDISTAVTGISLSEEANKEFFAELQNKCDTLKNDPKSELSVIGYYKSDRNLTNLEYQENISNLPLDRFDSLKNALSATANFTDLATWFFWREYEELREGKNQKDINFELPDLKQIRKAISTIIAPNARVYFSGATSAKLMVEWTMETGEKRELLLSQLSAGYRNMLALVMDFARRLAQANPHMENPLSAEAILMIDELDLHLHPTWQQNIIPDLKKVFPNTQIIATTHSPEVVTTVKQNQVKILEDYQIKECPSPTKGMKSSDIVRYVLGLSDLRPDTEESRTLTRLFEAIDNGQLEEAKRLRQELQHWESYDPDMTRADMQIRKLERRNAV